jgi:hypothetical protein
VAITFTRTSQGAYDPETDLATPSTSTVTGVAVRGRGDPDRYAALGLVESTAPTLVFIPTTYGELPAPGDTTTWPATGGSDYTVRDVTPFSPDGVAIGAFVIIEA